MTTGRQRAARVPRSVTLEGLRQSVQSTVTVLLFTSVSEGWYSATQARRTTTGNCTGSNAQGRVLLPSNQRQNRRDRTDLSLTMTSTAQYFSFICCSVFPRVKPEMIHISAALKDIEVLDAIQRSKAKLNLIK